MIYSVNSFLTSLSNLTKKPKDGYSECKIDIAKIICTLSFIEICNSDDLLIQNELYQIRKLRIPNSTQKSGKSSGYRLILLCDLTKELVFLLYVYPKKGKLSAPDLTLDGLDILLEQFKKSNEENELYAKFCSDD